MTETVRGEVLHVVPPDELADYDLDEDLQTLAESRYVLVCRKGGSPSWYQLLWSFLTRDPIEAITLVADSAVTEGTDVDATVEETTIPGVYDVRELEHV